MTGLLERWRRTVVTSPAPVRWTIGLLAICVAAVVVWFALGPADDGRYAETVTPASSGGDVVPPAEEDTGQVAGPGASGAATQDVIPPDEP
jgi:hypothetical protein